MPGYDVVVANGGSYAEFICSSCKLLLKDAVQLVGDGRRICFSCFDESQHYKKEENEDEFLENLNNGPLSIAAATAKEQGYFPDRFARKFIAEIQVYCKFKEEGCVWVGPIKEFQEHIDLCDKKSILCPKCGQAVAEHILEQHLMEKCQERIVNCNFCTENLKFCLLESHLKVCKNRPYPCDKCGMAVPPEQATDHQQIWCQKATGICPFNDEGCRHEEIMDKKGLSQHVNENLVFHLLLLLTYLKRIVRSLDDLRGKLYAIKNDLYNRFEDLAASIHVIQSKVVSWTDFIKDQIQKQWKELEKTNSKVINCEDQLQEVYIEKAKFEDELAEVKDKTFAHENQIFEHLSAIAEMQNQLKSMAGKVDALRTGMYELRQSHLQLSGQAPISKLPAPVYPSHDSPDYRVSYNGESIWKISGVTRLRQEAILNTTKSFFSPPFYTSLAGYKCCGRLYLNGDGPAKGTHISLFFVILKGPFDALQTWPFCNKVSLMLLNQDGKDNHVESFKPDASSSSFQRPTKDANVATGSPFFYSLNELESGGFLKDDTIFIRIKISQLNE